MQDAGGPSGSSAMYAGESSGGEDGAKGLKEWWGRFKAGKGAASSSATPALNQPSVKGKEVPTEVKGACPSRLDCRRRILAAGLLTSDHLPPRRIWLASSSSAGKPVFAMPLGEAITYASITISTPAPSGEFFVWGVVPTVVARWYVISPRGRSERLLE